MPGLRKLQNERSAKGKTIRETIEEGGLLTPEELAEVMDTRAMTEHDEVRKLVSALTCLSGSNLRFNYQPAYVALRQTQ